MSFERLGLQISRSLLPLVMWEPSQPPMTSASTTVGPLSRQFLDSKLKTRALKTLVSAPIKPSWIHPKLRFVVPKTNSDAYFSDVVEFVSWLCSFRFRFILIVTSTNCYSSINARIQSMYECQTFWTAGRFQKCGRRRGPHHIIRCFHYLVDVLRCLKKALRLTCEQGRCAP